MGRASTAVVTIDVTEQVNLTKQLHQTSKLEAIGRLANGMTHDFNNVLAGIRGLTQMVLTQDKRAPGARKDLESIIGLTDRAAALIRRLLTLGRREVNARDALEAGGAVRVHTERTSLLAEPAASSTSAEPAVAMMVTDSGAGIPPEIRDRLAF